MQLQLTILYSVCLYSPDRPDRFWSPPSLPHSVCWAQSEADHSHHVAQRLRMGGAIFPFPHTTSWLAQRFYCIASCVHACLALTPCSRVLLEKLIGLQLVKKFPAFYRTRRFITAFTNARHLSLSWASSIQSIPPHPTSWRSTLL